MFRTLLGLAVLGLTCLALGGPPSLRSAPTDKDDKGEKASKAIAATPAAIKKALDGTTTVDFAEQPLSAVLTAIGNDHGLSIQLDRALANMGIDPNLTVNVQQKNVKLRSGLRNMLAEHGLDFGVFGDHLLVSTEDRILHLQFKQRMNLSVEGEPLGKLLKALERDSGVTVLIDPRCVKAKQADEPVTLSVEDMPLETLVRLACELGGLKPVRMGSVIFVTTEARADKLKDGDLLNGAIGPGPLPPGGIGLGAVPFANGNLVPIAAPAVVPVAPVPAAPPVQIKD